MNSRHHNINSLWADLMVEELVRNGIDFFCLSPGSRSTPLVAAVATNSPAKKTMHFDERGAAFSALGYARAKGKAGVVVATSGTAGANYYPAVIEAAMDHVPVLVITADRPPELRGTGANQTIDQVKMYGDYARWFFDVPCPTDKIPPEFVLTTVDQAVYRAQYGPAGPVHLNCMYREPLAPIGEEQDFREYLAPVKRWREGAEPYTLYRQPVKVCEPARMEIATKLLNGVKRGVVLVGRLLHEAERQAVAKVAEALDWPVIADIGSGMRLGDDRNVIPYADQMLASEKFGWDHTPDTVLQFGPMVTSKRVGQWLARMRPKNWVQVAGWPDRQDPQHQVTHRFEADIEMFCGFLLPFLSQKKAETNIAAWREGSEKAGTAIDTILAEDGMLSEPMVARLVSQHIDKSGALWPASSMPIRDMDMFAGVGRVVPVGCNRGASGIDGTVASAVGFGIGHEKRVTLLIGDLALLHDLNSLALVRMLKQPMVIVAINNNGGGIFHFLPIAERRDLFESYWGTPHGLTFEQAAGMFGLGYVVPKTPDEFVQIYREAQQGARSVLIEVQTEREENVGLHRRLTEGVVRALEG